MLLPHRRWKDPMTAVITFALAAAVAAGDIG
jgi:hypothetical protein